MNTWLPQGRVIYKQEDANKMIFKTYVHIGEDGEVLTEPIKPDGKLGRKKKYKNIEALPEPLKEKVKMLMWTHDNDVEGLANVGVKVGGTGHFWVA